MYERQVHYTTLTQTLLHVAAATANGKNRVFCLLLQCMLRLLGEKRNSYCIKKKEKKKEKRTHVRFSPSFFSFRVTYACTFIGCSFCRRVYVCVCVFVRVRALLHTATVVVFFFLFTYAFPLQWMPVVVVRGGCWIATFFPLRYRDQLQLT